MANQLKDDIKKVLKNTYPSPARFWKVYLDAFQDSDSINIFCMRLFEQLIKSSKDQFLDDDHEAMYSTLMILEFYKNTKLKTEKWSDQTAKMYAEHNPKLFEHARWIIRLYMKSAEDNEFATNFLSALCHVAEKFTWTVQPGQEIQAALREAHQYSDIIELKRRDKPYKKLAHIAFDPFLRESRLASFGYCCFMDYLRSTNYQPKKKVWTHTLELLKGLIHAQRSSTKAYDLMTLLLHFISVLLRFYGCAYEDILKEMIYLVNLLRNSHGYNYKMAAEVFELIHCELKSPGYTFRKEIKRRFVNIDLKKAESLGSKKYYLTYRKVAFNNPQFCSINNLRKLVIYNVLGSFKVDNIAKYWAVVQPLDTDITFDLYYKIMRIVDITFNLQTYESIHKLTRENIAELFKSSWRPYRKLRKEEQSELADLVVPEHTQRYFQFPNFELVNVRPEQLVALNHEHSMLQLFEEIKQHPYNQFFYSSFLELIFLGNDEELSRILQMVCQFLVRVQACEYQKLVFYLLPFRDGECLLAEYLASKDLWYRRHVYNIFRERLLMPYVSMQDPEIKDSFPSYLYTKSFHMYVREAQRKAPFQLFQCEITTQDAQGRKEFKTIYFINNVLMGSSLQATLARIEMRKEKEKKNNYVDSLEVYFDKIKKASPVSIDLTVRYKQPGTEELVTTAQKFMLIEDLQICNTPKEYFFGYKPNPFTEFIEISVLTQNASKVFKTELETKENFKRHSDQEIAESFRDLFINMTAESIVIQRSEGMKDYFRLLVDSVEYQDVEQFKIIPAYTNEKLPLTLPVRCFLPFEP